MGAEVRGGSYGFPETGKKVKGKRLRDESWRKAAANKELHVAETQPLQTYLDSTQATMA